MQTILLCLMGYLLGSMPFGKILGNLKGIDIQKKGSGNIGFANAVRVLGWNIGILVLLGDILKGFIPIYIAARYLSADSWQLYLVGITPILGHAFPVWLKFRGGKSIATGFGVTIALMPTLAIFGIVTYLLAFLVLRKSDISSLISAWLLPVYCIFLVPNLVIFYLALAVFATYTHRLNISKYIHIYDITA